jgi:hypothetical protein
MSDQTKVLVIFGVIVAICIWIVSDDDPRCWRWLRRRWHQRRVWRDLAARRDGIQPRDERAKRVLP